MEIPEGVDCRVGKYTYGTPTIKSWFKPRKLRIGSFCSIGGNVTMYLDGAHDAKNVSTFPFEMFCEDWKDHLPEEPNDTKGDILIGSDVWIGDNVSILYDSTIGDGSIIGAYSVVRGYIPPYSIVIGNPARAVTKRFSDEQITHLLLIQWWNWSDEKIKENIGLLMSHDIRTFIDKHIRHCFD